MNIGFKVYCKYQVNGLLGGDLKLACYHDNK